MDRSTKRVGIGFPNEYVWLRGHRKVLSTSQLKQIIGAIYVLNKVRCRCRSVLPFSQPNLTWQARPKWAENPDGTWGDFHILLRSHSAAIGLLKPWIWYDLNDLIVCKFEESWARNLRNRPHSHLRVGWTFSCTVGITRPPFFASRKIRRGPCTADSRP